MPRRATVDVEEDQYTQDSETNGARPRRQRDELQIMHSLTKVIDNLDEPGQQRVINYLSARYRHLIVATIED